MGSSMVMDVTHILVWLFGISLIGVPATYQFWSELQATLISGASPEDYWNVFAER